LLNRILNFIKLSETKSKESDSNDIIVCGLALLIEVAKSDNEFSDVELKEITQIACHQFSIPQEQKGELLTLAKSISTESTSLYEFTSVINEHYSSEEKFQLISAMWKVAFADSKIDRYEEHIIRKVADLIYVPHMKFIEAKHEASLTVKSVH